MALDIRTLIMLAAVVALLNGASLRYVLREYPADLAPSIRLWTLGVLAQATAWILFGLRDQIPDWLSIVGANSLLSLAFAEQVYAVRLFGGLPVGRVAVYAPVVAVLLDEIVFTYAMPSMRLRLLTATPWFCLQMIQGGLSLVSSAAVSRRSGRLTAAAKGRVPVGGAESFGDRRRPRNPALSFAILSAWSRNSSREMPCWSSRMKCSSACP